MGSCLSPDAFSDLISLTKIFSLLLDKPLSKSLDKLLTPFEMKLNFIAKKFTSIQIERF